MQDDGVSNPAYGNIQPTLFEVSPGNIVALLRTGVNVIAAAVSTKFSARHCLISRILCTRCSDCWFSLLRSLHISHIAILTGSDYGATFSQFASPTVLPNPDAGIDGTVMNNLPGVPMILLYNHNTNARNPLSLAVSKVCVLAPLSTESREGGES